MLSIENLKTAAHKANAIDKRAIANLREHLQTEIYLDGLDIGENELADECNYITVGEYNSISNEPTNTYGIAIIEEKNKHKRFPKTYSSGKIDNTIGAIMRAKGIDLAEI